MRVARRAHSEFSGVPFKFQGQSWTHFGLGSHFDKCLRALDRASEEEQALKQGVPNYIVHSGWFHSSALGCQAAKLPMTAL